MSYFSAYYVNKRLVIYYALHRFVSLLAMLTVTFVSTFMRLCVLC